ncbi:hypothetical protein Tco_0865863, partial [Tanacetum coccineum]
TWDEMVEDMQGTPTATDVVELSQRMTNFIMTVRQDTDEIYGRFDFAQDHRSLMSGSRMPEANTAHEALTLLRNCRPNGSAIEPQETDLAYRGTNSTEDTADSDGSATESADT